MRVFETPKGTKFPLLSLKGKEYLEVKYRIVWFREEHIDWRIHTTVIQHDPDHSLVRADILNEKNEIMAQAHKIETANGFADHLEKAETSAIGRALALCGYGTQFTVDMEEGERIVDSPVEKKTVPPKSGQAPKEQNQSVPGKGGPGAYVLKMGVHKSKRLDDITPGAIADYVNWLKTKASDSVRNSQSGKNDLFAAELYLRSNNISQSEAELFGNRGPDNGPPPGFQDEPWPDSAYDAATKHK